MSTPSKLAATLGGALMVLGAAACATAPAQAKGPGHQGTKRHAAGATIHLSDRVVDLQGGISDGMIKAAQKRLFALDAQSHEPIWIRINSPGGSVDAGLILIDTFRALESPVRCLVESRAYSMAAITLLFCDERYALDHASIMLHEASYGTMGEDPTNRARLAFITRYLDRVHHELAARLHMPYDKYRAKIRDAWWMMASEAKEAGVIDGVVSHIVYDRLPVEKRETKRTVTIKVREKILPPEVAGETIPKRR